VDSSSSFFTKNNVIHFQKTRFAIIEAVAKCQQVFYIDTSDQDTVFKTMGDNDALESFSSIYEICLDIKEIVGPAFKKTNEEKDAFVNRLNKGILLLVQINN